MAAKTTPTIPTGVSTPNDLPHPAGFSRVMEGHQLVDKRGRGLLRLPAKRDCGLFRLPDKAIAFIVDLLKANHVEPRDLEMISPGFRLLARSHRFCAVTLDGRHQFKPGDGMLSHLALQAFERRQNRSSPGKTHKPCVGACIRRIDYHGNANPEDWESTAEQPDSKKRGNSAITQIIPSLPNLHTLRLKDIALNQILVNSLLMSTVECVTLEATAVTRTPRVRQDVTWPITSLSMSLTADEEFDASISQYWHNILRPCAPTLEQLTMSHLPNCRWPRRTARKNEQQLTLDLHFPKLTHLDIKLTECLDEYTFRSLLFTSTRLQYLSFDCSEPGIWNWLSRPNFTALRTLVVNYKPWRDATPLEEMRSKPMISAQNLWGLTSFACTGFTSSALSDGILRQLYICSKLERLMVAWEPQSWMATGARKLFLEGLSRNIPYSLKELYLIIGTDRTAFTDVQHFNIRQTLHPRFRELTRLVVTGWRDYEGRIVTDTRVPVSAESAAEHKVFMNEARSYGNVFPKLEVLRINDVTINIVRDKEGLHIDYSTKEFDFPFLGAFDGHVHGAHH